MKLLILGGTGFLGPHVVQTALDRGHTMTLFNRGRTNTHLFPELERLKGDRGGDLRSLEGRSFDAVIDTTGYVPGDVGRSAGLLKDAVNQYIFISTISVYANSSEPVMHEGGELAQYTGETPADKLARKDTVMTDYGCLKALCEAKAESLMPDRVTTIRPHLVVGPGDSTDRYTWWPWRIAQGGEVLVPAPPEAPVTYIDGRDLARFILETVENGHVGIYDAAGPKHPLRFDEFVHTAKTVADSDATFTWVAEEHLLAHNVQPWMGLPLWIPLEGRDTFSRCPAERARDIGLSLTSPAVTLRDTLDWIAEHRHEGHSWGAGISAELEAKVLETWHAKEKH